MDQLPEVSGLIRTKNTHSLSFSKFKQTLPKNLSIPSFYLAEDTSSKTPKPVQVRVNRINPHLSPQSDSKKKNFFEMIGIPSIKEKQSNSPKLRVDVQSPRIALTDFMGKNKYSFLKKTGYIDYYDEYKKNSEFQRIVDQKNTLNMPNIIHTDRIRENFIKNSNSPRITEISTLFEKPRYAKHQQQDRIDIIQKIINQCDNLYKESKKIKNVEKELREDAVGKIVVRKRKAVRRLTVQEKFLIKKQIENF